MYSHAQHNLYPNLEFAVTQSADRLVRIKQIVCALFAD